MAYTLNTGHALYGNLIELIGVEGGALVSLKTARTFTKHAEASFGTGTYGEHFTTVDGGYTVKGASFTPEVAINTNTTSYTTVVVLNRRAGVSAGGGSILGKVSGTPGHNLGWSNAGSLNLYQTGNLDFVGGAIPTTAQLLAFVRLSGDGALNGKLYSGSSLLSTGNPGYASAASAFDYIGGNPGSCALSADVVWIAFFNKELTSGELASLSASLGASNTFGLVNAAANSAPTFPGPSIGNQTGTVGTPISFSVASKFSDTDTLTFSAIGTWPAGVTVSSAGLVSGTPSAAGTYATLNVRATDTIAQTVDSDVFTFTISAAGNGTAAAGTGTSTGSGTGGTASGLGSGTFTSDAMENNTGAGLLASTSVSWTWYQGVIGAAPTSTTHGTGTTSVGGVLTVSGLPTGTGFLLVRTADSSGVYYQPGTVT